MKQNGLLKQSHGDLSAQKSGRGKGFLGKAIPGATRNTLKFLIANESLIRGKIAVAMSEVYNGTWGGGATITPEELAQRIKLTDVSFYEEGGGELYYEADDELFTDHTICASIDADGEIGEPELAG